MKVFWNDCGRELPSDQAREVDLHEAQRMWADGSGVRGNFLGLIDGQDRTVQFLFDESIPDEVEDAGHLRIVLMDVPCPELRGSYGRQVTVDEARELIATAFRVGADHRRLGELTFTPW